MAQLGKGCAILFEGRTTVQQPCSAQHLRPPMGSKGLGGIVHEG